MFFRRFCIVAMLLSLVVAAGRVRASAPVPASPVLASAAPTAAPTAAGTIPARNAASVCPVRPAADTVRLATDVVPFGDRALRVGCIASDSLPVARRRSAPGDERADRFYDSLRTKMGRRAAPRMIYRMLFVRPELDTTAGGRVLDERRLLEPYAGRRIARIRIESRPVFPSGDNWAERFGNKLHIQTREEVLRRDLLFAEGDRLDPELVVRNKELLRSRTYIAEVDVEVRPAADDTTAVEVTVLPRDNWSIGLDMDFRSGGRTMLGVYDANIFGTGNLLRLRTNFDRGDFSYGGNEVELEVPNLLGTFFGAHLLAGRSFYASTLDVELRKDFIRPTDFEAGISYADIKDKRYMREHDTTELVRSRRFDVWGGKSCYLPSIRSSIYFTGRYGRLRYGRRPPVDASYNPALHEQDALLVGAGLYRERFYSTSLLYGFGLREYLAAGYKAEVTSGYTWGEFSEDLYLGLTGRIGGFNSWGYMMGGFTLGSFIDMQSGAWTRSAVDVDLRWHSNLVRVRRTRIRQFLGLDYTEGWNRLEGADERIGFTDRNGLHALRAHTIGTTRMAFNTETVLFTPYQLLGFRFAFFGFGDFGTIGCDANPFRNTFFGTLGVGARIRNEHLAFHTIQIRLGIAFGRPGWVDARYLSLSGLSHDERIRYRPTRPEIVGFE